MPYELAAQKDKNFSGMTNSLVTGDNSPFKGAIGNLKNSNIVNSYRTSANFSPNKLSPAEPTGSKF